MPRKMVTTDTRRRAKYVLVFVLISCAAIGGGMPAAAQDPIPWTPLGEAQEQARVEGKTLFVFVEAAWCSLCKRMKRDALPRDDVRSLLADRYVAVTIDLDSQNEVSFNGKRSTERVFARTMNVQATPTMIFVGPDGSVLGTYAGYVDQDRFHELLRYVVSDVFGDISFDEYVERSRRR